MATRTPSCRGGSIGLRGQASNGATSGGGPVDEVDVLRRRLSRPSVNSVSTRTRSAWRQPGPGLA